jgi:NADPH:quinone reductase-like Zn-dependent oxidoreductase
MSRWPGNQYDLILDAAAFRPFSAYLPILTTTGTYVAVGGSTGDFLRAMALGSFVSKADGKQVKSLESKPNQADLATLKELAEAGKLTPVHRPNLFPGGGSGGHSPSGGPPCKRQSCYPRLNCSGG